MAVYVCPHCSAEHSSKKKLRACIFSHTVDQKEEIEIVEEQVEEIEEVPEGEYYVSKPVVVKAYQKNGEWEVTSEMGLIKTLTKKEFEQHYARCDGEFAPVVIPRRLCPTEIQYLGTNQIMVVKANCLLTTDYDLEVKSIDFIRR